MFLLPHSIHISLRCRDIPGYDETGSVVGYPACIKGDGVPGRKERGKKIQMFGRELMHGWRDLRRTMYLEQNKQGENRSDEV